MSLLNTIIEKASLPKVAFVVCGLCLPLKPAYACMRLNEPLDISICVAGTSWELREDKADSALFYNTEDGFAGSLRFFDGGTDNGVESEHAARLMAQSDSKESQDFALLKSGKVSSGNYVYAARGSVNGRSNIYVNTISVGPTKTLRITTWRIGDTMSDKDREMHIAFGNLLKTGL